MAQATVVRNDLGDWEGVYADDHLVSEGHHVSVEDALRGFRGAGIDDVDLLTDVSLDRWGHCPESLADLKASL